MSEQSQAQSKADRGGAPLAGHRAKAEAQNKHESLTAKRPPVPDGCAVAAGRGVGSLAAKGGQCAYTCADVADALPQTEKVSEQSQAQSKADRGGAPLAGHRAKAEAQNKHESLTAKQPPVPNGLRALHDWKGGRAIKYGDIKYNVGYVSPACGRKHNFHIHYV